MPISRPLRAAIVLAALLTPFTAQFPSRRSRSAPHAAPKNIVDVFDAEPLPQATSARTTGIASTTARQHPSIAELAQPMYRLAGDRINPKTNGPRVGGNIYKITLRAIATGAETTVTLPPQPRVSIVRFSPDGSHLSFLNTKDTAIEVWVADVATGNSKLVSGTDRANATTGDPCDWLHDNVTIVCEMVPAGRGPAPQAPEVPAEPNVQENTGRAGTAATYETC
jgi:hypothetical protein